MKKILPVGFVVLALGFGASAQAQSHGTAMRVFAPTHARVVRVAPAQASFTQASNDIILVSGSSSVPVTFAETFPVPGLGFDFPHFAAVHRNLRTVIVQPLTPFIPVAFPFFNGAVQTPQVIVVQQPAPVVVVQQPPAQDVAVRAAGAPRSVGPSEDLDARQPAPTHDAGEFVLVRRDGRLVFAVAFITAGNQLTYVTRDGVRRSLALSDLDIDATVRMNEERGTSIHLPV